MIEGLSGLTLNSINSGAGEEIFQQALKKIEDNIRDPNFKTTAKRSIVVTVDFTPDNDGEGIDILVSVDAKIPGRLGHKQRAYLMDNGIMQGVDPRKLQTEMDLGIKSTTERQAM